MVEALWLWESVVLAIAVGGAFSALVAGVIGGVLRREWLVTQSGLVCIRSQ